MTCRHGPNDPSCSSHKDYVDYSTPDPKPSYSYSSSYSSAPTTPDAENYNVQDVEQVGNHLVLKVQYPNCSRCSYEGNKVMVFLNTSTKDALKWRKIDPHFRDPKKIGKFTEAPSPAARFPASDEGWKDALNYARSKTSK